MQTFLIKTFLLASVGVTLEIIFTSITTFLQKRDLRLQGYSYLWMLPIYALTYTTLTVLWPIIHNWFFVLRGLIYVILIYFAEYLTGWMLRKTMGQCPWEKDYKGKRWAIKGLIRLDYAPAWFVASLLLEYFYLFLKSR